jgi:ligand-binding sensor domain-containing protein
MKRILTTIVTGTLFFTLSGQTPVGTWSDHLTYNTANSIAAGTHQIYASTGSSIIIYDKDFDELKKVSRINGLTETEISTIGWSEENSTLIVAYSTTNIDLLKNNTIINIPDIKRKYVAGKKEINRIRTNGKYAYLACSFGIVVLDILKNEIYDTWKPGPGSENAEVWDIAFGDNRIYAATGMGVYSAVLSNTGLSYFANWNLLNILPSPSGKYTSLCFAGNKLYANRKDITSNGDFIYSFNGTSSLFSYLSGVFNSSFDQSPAGFTVSSSAFVRYFNTDGSLNKTISSYGTEWNSPQISQAIAENGNIWIADYKSGLLRGESMSAFTALTLPGPASNNAFSITSSNGKTIICGGATDVSWNNRWRPLEVSINENNRWTTVSPGNLNDALRALIDPENSNHFFISTWGKGLLEYENNILVKQFNDSNSPLQTIIPGQPYVRICGLAMDKAKNLWITQTEVAGTIKVLKPDGSWIVNPVTINAPSIGDIIITRNGHKWVVLPRGHGLFVLDDNNTPDIFTDDRSKKMFIADSENKLITLVYSIAEDLDGNIWVGTDQGPLIYYNPEKVFDEELKAFRVKIPRNDGTGLSDYMLKTEIITSIAVDGANRKWLGTFSSGAYHLSPDGTILLKNFNEENSPILSNSIVTLNVDNKSGDVWFGTSKGIQSFRGDAISGAEEFSNVYTFPNPVREDFTGNVTITGLMKDSQIRITDISGNLVFETVSNGGEATWDLNTYTGRRVSTGVYLVFCASTDGAKSFVTKMLVIR